LAGDASQRRYARCRDVHGLTSVLVTYPQNIRSELRRNLEVIHWCREHGIRVPSVLAWDLDRGVALLEDFGDVDGEAALDDLPPDGRASLLTRLLQPLERLAEVSPQDLPPWNPPLDRNRLRWELTGFELWYVRHLKGFEPSAAVSRWLDALADEVAGHPARICHRDYHLNNLLLPDDGPPAVIDIQDILVGPDTYDVVSLVFERAAVDLLDPAQRRQLLEDWAQITEPTVGWGERARLVRLQRGLKVLGTFARFAMAGRRRYEPWLTELAARLAPQIEAVAAPPEVVALLLD
jgi:aminoglycoside/choline kinase family phosphotransferase